MKSAFLWESNVSLSEVLLEVVNLVSWIHNYLHSEFLRADIWQLFLYGKLSVSRIHVSQIIAQLKQNCGVKMNSSYADFR